MTASKSIGSLSPAVSIVVALGDLDRAAGWLGDAEAWADPVKHGRAFRAAWRHMLRLRRSLERLRRRLEREQAGGTPAKQTGNGTFGLCRRELRRLAGNARPSGRGVPPAADRRIGPAFNARPLTLPSGTPGRRTVPAGRPAEPSAGIV